MREAREKKSAQRGATSVRLFVAVYPAMPEASAMLARVQRVTLPEGAKMAPVDQVHCTLVFIGDTPVKRMAEVIESVDRAAAGFRRFALRPSRLATLPLNKPARVLAMLTDAPAGLMEIQRRLAQRLAKVEDRKRAFVPHFTLARYDIQRAAPVVDDELRAGEVGDIAIGGVRLMSSHLGAGAVVHRLEHERVLE